MLEGIQRLSLNGNYVPSPTEIFWKELNQNFPNEKIMINSIKSGAQLNRPDNNGRLPLNQMLRKGLTQAVHIALEHDVDPLITDREGNNAFFCTANWNLWAAFCKKMHADDEMRPYFGESRFPVSLKDVVKITNNAGESMAGHLIENNIDPQLLLDALRTLIEDEMAPVIFSMAHQNDFLTRQLQSREPNFDLCAFLLAREVIHVNLNHLREAAETNQFAFCSLFLRYVKEMDEDTLEFLEGKLSRQNDAAARHFVHDLYEKILACDTAFDSIRFAAKFGLNKQLSEELADKFAFLEDLQAAVEERRHTAVFILLENNCSPRGLTLSSCTDPWIKSLVDIYQIQTIDERNAALFLLLENLNKAHTSEHNSCDYSLA